MTYGVYRKYIQYVETKDYIFAKNFPEISNKYN